MLFFIFLATIMAYLSCFRFLFLFFHVIVDLGSIFFSLKFLNDPFFFTRSLHKKKIGNTFNGKISSKPMMKSWNRAGDLICILDMNGFWVSLGNGFCYFLDENNNFGLFFLSLFMNWSHVFKGLFVVSWSLGSNGNQGLFLSQFLRQTSQNWLLNLKFK